MADANSDLWTCPKCGAQFVTPNMWHSCGVYDLADLFAKSEPAVLELFQELAARVASVGAVTVIPQKTRVCFQRRVRFLSVYPRRRHLLCEFGFSERVESPRFHRIEHYGPRWVGHSCNLSAASDLDAEFMGWVALAYEVGQQKHLRD